ncbi:hypothetical protein [Streptomyces fuscichromogenes]|uniref:Uncharacterized protein n=1 Tax=Streptomyces fuscichromogenes TaxID=1324013 RepID=A0A917XEJ5_9ACTN|nr:hypothetical protein [Streptomyces fuscichromogenes]GGN16224.1 hypothetical protein GCM10011578_044610 [Streptomyces fuscichromogenes]
MAVERENIETLMRWLADGSPARSAHAGADALVEKLAAVVFGGEWAWPDRADQADVYRDRMRDWFTGDSGHEDQFTELTAPDADPGMFIDWFLPVVVEREGREVRDAAGQPEDGERETGWANPNFDGTPGTEFYRADEATGEYLYASREAGPDWAAYDERRYLEPARDDSYGLDCRYDRRDGVYEWYDEASGTWEDQAWADEYTARGDDGTGNAADRSEAVWDDNWRMFYRLDLDGVYQYADARSPGDQPSGCGDVWLTAEQAQQRVIPVHLIPGWHGLQGESWARDWYALPDGAGGYRYLHSPGRTPDAGEDGWSQVPPAPPLELTSEQEEVIASMGFTLDEAAEAIEAFTQALSAWGVPEA